MMGGLGAAGGLLAFAFMAVFLAAGFLAACRFFGEREPQAVRVAMGAAFGLFLMMWLPALVSFVAGFTPAAQWVALALALALACALCLRRRRGAPGLRFAPPAWTARGLLCRGNAVLAATVAPLLVLSLGLLWTHTLAPGADGGLHVGQSTYGDLSLHAGLITSISWQRTFPPNYSLLSGSVPVGYPFLCDSISSSLLSVGAPLRLAYMMPMAAALFSLLAMAYLFFRSWLGSDGKASFATSLFFVGGGFGFAYFFDLYRQPGGGPGKLSQMMSSFYDTPTNYPSVNLRWVNVIADMLIPQRATLFGWAVLVPCLYLLMRAVFDEGRRDYFAPLAALAGGLPLVHTHSFLALALVSAACFAYAASERARRAGSAADRAFAAFALCGAGALALALPQLALFTFRQASASGGGFVKWHFNWANDQDNYFWFYVKNIGLPYIFAVPAFLHAGRRLRWLYGGGLLVLLVGELAVFQPNEYDNNKLLFVWFLLTCGIFASWCADVFSAMRGGKAARGAWFAAAAVVAACNVSGVLTLAREAASDYVLFEGGHVQAAEFIKGNTAPDALFLTASNHNNAVAALAGRNIVCGTGSYLYYHGVRYDEAEMLAYELLTDPTPGLVEASGIDYVYMGDYERSYARGGGGAAERFYASSYAVAYENELVTIYKVR